VSNYLPGFASNHHPESHHVMTLTTSGGILWAVNQREKMKRKLVTHTRCPILQIRQKGQPMRSGQTA
jgi:hypothetical protein